jgi:hypothetical protein
MFSNEKGRFESLLIIHSSASLKRRRGRRFVAKRYF